MFGKVFSKTKVNVGRQLELDIVKCFAIVLMILVHCFGFCAVCSFEGSLMEHVFLFLQFSAPLFMFCMGCGMIYTRHNTASDFISRGWKLFLMGFIINGFYALSGLIGGQEIEYVLLSLLSNDILQFAGLSFIVIGLLKKCKFSLFKILIVAVLFSVLGSIFNHNDFESNIWLGQILGHIIAAEGYKVVSCFPLLNWFIVPVVGMVFGDLLIRTFNKESSRTSLYPAKKVHESFVSKNDFYKVIAGLTVPFGALVFIAGNLTREGMFSSVGGRVFEKLDYIHINTFDVVLLIIMLLAIIAVAYYVMPYLGDTVKNVIKMCSRNVTNIYIIQWALILLVINPLAMLLGVESSYLSAVLTILFVTVGSAVLAEVYRKRKMQK